MSVSFNSFLGERDNFVLDSFIILADEGIQGWS